MEPIVFRFCSNWPLNTPFYVGLASPHCGHQVVWSFLSWMSRATSSNMLLGPHKATCICALPLLVHKTGTASPNALYTCLVLALCLHTEPAQNMFIEWEQQKSRYRVFTQGLKITVLWMEDIGYKCYYWYLTMWSVPLRLCGQALCCPCVYTQIPAHIRHRACIYS